MNLLLKCLILYTVFNSNLVFAKSQDEQESYQDIHEETKEETESSWSPTTSEKDTGWNPSTSEFTGTSTFDTEPNYYNPTSQQFQYGQEEKTSIWQTIKELVSPKSTYDPETHFDNLISYDPGYTQAYGQEEKTGIWQTIKELISPKLTYDPETHFDKLLSPDPGYSQEHGQEEKTGIWETIKKLVSPKSTYDPETHFDNLISSGPVYGQEQKQSLWKQIKNYLLPKPTHKQQINTLYESHYSDIATSNPEYSPEIKEGLWKKIKELLLPQHIKDVISPVETADPDKHFDEFLSEPFVETALNQISQTKEDFFDRVSHITHKDILDSTVVWWKIMYQLMLVLVAAVIGGAFLVDLTMEGGLV